MLFAWAQVTVVNFEELEMVHDYRGFIKRRYDPHQTTGNIIKRS